MSDHKTRLARALAATNAAGLSRFSSFPPFLRLLGTLGLPVRPLHFMSTLGLALFLCLGPSTVVCAFHWLALQTAAEGRLPNRMRDLGLLGSVGHGTAAGLLAAVVIRLQAARVRLPAWRDL